MPISGDVARTNPVPLVAVFSRGVLVAIRFSLALSIFYMIGCIAFGEFDLRFVGDGEDQKRGGAICDPVARVGWACAMVGLGWVAGLAAPIPAPIPVERWVRPAGWLALSGWVTGMAAGLWCIVESRPPGLLYYIAMVAYGLLGGMVLYGPVLVGKSVSAWYSLRPIKVWIRMVIGGGVGLTSTIIDGAIQ